MLRRTAAIAVALAAVAACPAGALGQGIRTGVGGEDQYVDPFPTASGPRPVTGLGSSGPAAAAPVPAATADALAAAGPDGQAVLDLAAATGVRAPDGTGGSGGSGAGSAPGGSPSGSGSGSAAGGVLADALGGSAGGLGLLLPIGLAAIAGACVGAALVRRR